MNAGWLKPAGVPNSPMRRLILCADDFALTTGISRAILALIEAGRLSATGAMTNRPAFAGFARELANVGERADIGVHLNLTCGAPMGPMPLLCPTGAFPPLSRVMRAALGPQAVRAEIALEIRRQLDAFETHAGRAPDFIDGHQHVHAMPGVRWLLLAEATARYARGAVALRNPSDRLAAILARGVAAGKALTVAGLAFGFARQARSLGYPLNDSFAGFSPFDPGRDFGRDFGRFLTAARSRHLVMVHPGVEDDAELAGLDPVTATRPMERDFLASQAMPDIVAGFGLRLGRFADAQAAG